MVDFIKHNLRQMSVPAPQSASHASNRTGAAPVAAVTDVAKSVDDGQLSLKASVSKMSETPPIDMEAVSRIKQAIANGEYPINLGLVSERLMESYFEMKGE